MAEKKKKGLGTGLDALFGNISEDDAKEGVISLPIARIEPRAEQPRQSFDDVSLNELADSIREYGLISPITVRAVKDGYYQIIAGERRWRAARLAGLHELPVRVLEADDRLTEELALVENLQREDLNPVEEALGVKRLIDNYGLNQEEAAGRIGKARSTVSNALRLLSLSAEVLELVEKGLLSAGHARALIPVVPEELQCGAARKVVAEELSVRQTEALAKRLMREKKETGLDDSLRADYIKHVTDELERALGRKVSLTERGRGGTIKLNYYGSDDREALIDALKSLAES